MKALKNLGQSPPPTTETADFIDSAEGHDVEKDVEIGQPEQNESIGVAHTIDPEVEKRVIKKLDWHVVPLVLALCEFS